MRVFIFPSAEAEAASKSVIRFAVDCAQCKHAASLKIIPTRRSDGSISPREWC